MMTPDSTFFFPSSKHLEALNSIYYVINERLGFVALTGEVGSGKTTVCRAVLNRLGQDTKVAVINNTFITPKQLIGLILDELLIEVDFQRKSKIQLTSRLNEFLIEQLSRDFNVVLIIDEAQNLNFKVLEELRMLSNLETENEKLIQIVLMGQPELKEKLELPRLKQLRQRVYVHYHLLPLDRAETEAYINHRLKVAGNNGRLLFPAQAIDLIFSYSGGIPRLINLICGHCLLTGYVKETTLIDEEIVKEVVTELRLNRTPETLSNPAITGDLR